MLVDLGRTQFLGRHIAEAAVAEGHEVTLFNRGNHPDVFPEMEQLRGGYVSLMWKLLPCFFLSLSDFSSCMPWKIGNTNNEQKEVFQHETDRNRHSRSANTRRTR